MKTKLVRWFGAALLIAYAMFSLLSYFTFAQTEGPQPQPKIVYAKFSDGQWHWYVKDEKGTVVAESWLMFPNKGTAYDDWQRLRVIAGRDPDEEVVEQSSDVQEMRTVPARRGRVSSVLPPVPSVP